MPPTTWSLTPWPSIWVTPATCPHGNPIPDADYEIEDPVDTPLHSLAIDQTGVISRVDRPETTLCRYLKDHDLLPGTRFTLIEEAPYNGPFILQTDHQQVAVGRQIAARLFVQLSD